MPTCSYRVLLVLSLLCVVVGCSIHVVEAGKGVVYPADNWLQRAGGAPFPDLYPEFRAGDAAGAATAPAAAAAAADTAAPAASAPASGAGTA